MEQSGKIKLAPVTLVSHLGDNLATGLLKNHTYRYYLFAKALTMDNISSHETMKMNVAPYLALFLGASAHAADSWPMFRGGPSLSGVAAGHLPGELKLLWAFKTGGAVKSSAAIDHGQAFIGSDDGSIYAIDLAKGEKKWSYKTGGPVDSSPLALDGNVYVGSADGSLYALEAGAGKFLWNNKTGDKMLGSPNSGDMGARDEGLFR